MRAIAVTAALLALLLLPAQADAGGVSMETFAGINFDLAKAEEIGHESIYLEFGAGLNISEVVAGGFQTSFDVNESNLQELALWGVVVFIPSNENWHPYIRGTLGTLTLDTTPDVEKVYLLGGSSEAGIRVGNPGVNADMGLRGSWTEESGRFSDFQFLFRINVKLFG